jgi:hypothetical protein
MSNNEQDQIGQNDAAARLPFEPDLSDATIKRALAPFISIASNDADAGQEAKTSSEAAEPAPGSGVEEVIVAETGYYAKSAWDESTARISRILESSWSDVPLSEAGQQAELALDAVEEELRLFSERASYFGRDGMTPGVAAERLNRCLAKLQDAELVVYQPKGGAHKTLPCFPRFLYLLAQVLNESIESGVLDRKSGTVQMFFDRANDYLERAMKSAFSERRLKINMELAGPRKELAYIYDHQTKDSLTRWVPLTGDSAPVLLRTLDILRDRVADAFMQELPFSEIQTALATVAGAGLALTAWSELRELLMLPELLPEPDAVQGTSGTQEGAQQGDPQHGEKIVVTRAAIRDLLLPGVGAQYLPEIEPNVQSVASQSIDFKPLAQEVLASFTEELIKKEYKELTKRLLVSIPMGALSPVVGIALNLIFPSEKPITKAEMEAEIDKRLKQALDKAYVSVIKIKFENCRAAFQARMQTIRNKEENKGKPQAEWTVGPPGEWESFLSVTKDLEGFLFAGDPAHPTDFTRYYLTHQLLSDAMTLRLNALYGKLQAAKPSDVVDFELTSLEACYKGWYLYLEKLLDFAWSKTRAWDDFLTEQDHTQSPGLGALFSPRYIIYDKYNYKNERWQVRHQYRLNSENTSKGNLGGPLNMTNQKAVIYATLNTAFRSMCQVYDAAVRKHNEKFGTDFPSAVGSLFDWTLGDGRYKATMNKFVQENTRYDDGGGRDHFTSSPFRGKYQRDGSDFLREDLFVETVSNSGSRRWYSVGDYPDLELDGDDAHEMKKMLFPMGFRAICYSEPNFGQYLDENGSKKYKGDYWILPNDRTKPHEVLNGRNVRSMKIRIELQFWHNRSVFGRIKDWKWADNNNPRQVADLELMELP